MLCVKRQKQKAQWRVNFKCELYPGAYERIHCDAEFAWRQTHKKHWNRWNRLWRLVLGNHASFHKACRPHEVPTRCQTRMHNKKCIARELTMD